jgi:putative tricarboxylic transport membrane protein
MTDTSKDIVLGFILLAVGLVWSLLVWSTIPPAFEDGSIGPRAFPLVLGVLLIGMSGLMLYFTASRRRKMPTTTAPTGPTFGTYREIKWGHALLLVAEICAYGFLLEKIGFLLATPPIVLAVMVINLRILSPRKLVGMALGLTVGCWLIFQKLMGIYLATGTWINLG